MFWSLRLDKNQVLTSMTFKPTATDLANTFYIHYLIRFIIELLFLWYDFG